MPSLRDSIKDHVVPFTTPMSLRAVGNLVGLNTPPVSTRDIMDFLAPPILFQPQHQPMHALTVHATTGLGLHPSGLYVFSGRAHENGVVGDNYAVSFAIDVRDDQGRALAFPPHKKDLGGTVDPVHDRNDAFQVIAFDQRIRDRWQEVVAARKEFSLHASTDPLQVVELVTETLVAALAVAGLTYLAITVIPLIPTPELIVSLPEDGVGFKIDLVWHF